MDPDIYFNINSRCDYLNEDKLNILSDECQSDFNFPEEEDLLITLCRSP